MGPLRDNPQLYLQKKNLFEKGSFSHVWIVFPRTVYVVGHSLQNRL
jgi:hypothetical protein